MALGDNVFARSGSRVLRGRLVAAIWWVALAFLLLLSRLYTLQVLRGEELSHKGRRNFVQRVTIVHDRGIIYDRYGRILVDNRPSLDLQVTPAFLGRGSRALSTLARLAELVGMSPEEQQRSQDLVGTRMGLDRFRPLVVRRDLTPVQVEAIEGERSLFMLDGVDIVEGRRRTYPYGSLAAHLFGYVNEIDASALDAERARGNPERYELGDIIGREGLERTSERQLRGADGTEQVVVDAKGRRQKSGYVEVLLGAQRRVEPSPGHNLFLTLDLDLQRRAEAGFAARGRAGSVVALDPRDGAILAMVSWPSYDANLLTGALAKAAKDRLDGDPLKPWINRSIAGQYAPGSTFKIVTALAGLRDHAFAPQDHIACPGNYRMGRHIWRCWREAGHGMLALHDAMRVSCDTFFYTLGGRLGLGPISEAARSLGLGSRTGIALRGEQPGIVPTEAFHNRVDAATGGYQRGMAINTSIGQGSLLVTPLQLANAYAALANGQSVFVPQLVHRIETADLRITLHRQPVLAQQGPGTLALGGIPLWLSPQPEAARLPPQVQVLGDGPTRVADFVPRSQHSLNFSPAEQGVVRDGLRAVASEPGGTAYSTRSRRVSMAAKTGTAQVVRLGARRFKDWETQYLERDHAWYVAYAPAEAPEIVVAVLNEHAGHGGSAAGPTAVEVIDAYFELQAQRRLSGVPSGVTHLGAQP